MKLFEDKNIGAFLIGLSISFFIFSISLSQIHFWDESNEMLFGAFRYSFIFVSLPLFILGILFKKTAEPFVSVSGIAVGLLFFFFSNWTGNFWSFLWQESMRGEIVLFSILSFIYIRKKCFSPSLILIFVSLGLLTIFLVESGGRAIFSDDHGPVYFRLSLLKNNFPFIPLYYPLWNSGLDARDFFATGILNFFLLFYPLLKIFPLESIYSLCVGLVLFVLVPASHFFSVRLYGHSKETASCAGLLGLITSILWYRWGLKYGSMGFVTSAALFPLTVSLLIKFFESKEVSRFIMWSALFFCTLTFMWSMSVVALAPLAVFGVIFVRDFLSLKTHRYFLIGLFLLNFYPFVMLASVSNVSKFVTLNKEHTQQNEFKDAGLAEPQTAATIKGISKLDPKKSFREYIISCSPVLLLFCLPGFFLIKNKWQLFCVLALAAWLTLLGTVFKGLKPQLELDRMLILLGVLLVFPASLVFEKLKKESSLLLAITFGFVLTGLISIAGVICNRSPEHFTWSNEKVSDIVSAIDHNIGEGRAVFLGFVLHELNKGHLAPLSVLTNKPLVASSPFHNKWKYTGVVPVEFLKDQNNGVEKFLDIEAASLVIAHEETWIQYLKNHPTLYTRVWKKEPFEMYLRNVPVSYFYEGSGHVLMQSENSVTLKVGTKNSVIKFQYFPFLESSQCLIQPRKISNDIELVELLDCDTNQEITIRAKTGLKRVIAEELS